MGYYTHQWTCSIRYKLFPYNSFQYNPKVVELHKNCDHLKDSFRVNKKNVWFEYSPFFKPSTWSYFHLD